MSGRPVQPGNSSEVSATSPPPLVSVVVVADLRTQFVRDAVDSVLSQTLPRESVELILVARFKDEILDTHFRSCGAYVIHVEDVALGPKLAAGLSHSKGTIVAFLEDDDIFEPDKLAAIVEHFRKNPKLILVKNAFTLFDEHPVAHPSSRRTCSRSETWPILTPGLPTSQKR